MLLVMRVRLGLTLSSFDRLRGQLLPRAARLDCRDPATIRRCARAVRLAARLVPFASCLTQALACQVLLARRGIASDLHLGVRPGRAGSLLAHAWLTVDGAVVLGGDRRGLAGFSPISRFSAGQ
jgi:hypothetical protein